MAPPIVRGLPGKSKKNNNKEEVVKRLGARVHDWLIIPNNAVITLCVVTLLTFLLGKAYGIGIYLTIGAYFFTKFCLKQHEQAPLKIPVQEHLLDDNQPHPATSKPMIGEGIFFIGVALFTNKEVWLTNDDARQHFLVLGTTGAGKAIPCSTPVHTQTGWKIAGNIRYGDMITTPFGETAKVTGVYPQGKRRIWKMTFEDGRISEIDGDHLWEIYNKHSNSKPQIMTTKELYELKNKGLFSIIVSDAPEKPAQNLVIPPYVMGTLLGNGCFNKISTSLTSEDSEIVNRVRSEMASHGYDVVQNDQNNYGIKRKQAQIPFHHLINKLGLSEIESYSKFIPEIYLEGSIEQRWALLQGLMDTDGTCDQKVSLSFRTSSERLAKDVQRLIWSLGGIAKIHPKNEGEKRNGKISYVLTIRMKTPEQAFYLQRKKELASKDYQYENLKLGVTNIEETTIEDDCVCFMVDHPRHLFVIKDYISTHNTELLTGFAANALSWGSGLIFVDGKGDIKLMATLHALSMRWGRSADFLMLNFMPQDDVLAPGEVASNTMNPYTTSPASDIIQQIGGLMPASGGDGMWKDRAMTMVSAVVYALAWARDQGIIDLNLAALRKYIQFRHLLELVTDERFADMPENIKNNIHIYLSSLAGYNGKPEPDQSDDCTKQHGFLEMQFTGPLGSLANDYGHIFNSEFGEVDMFDVVLNRRILVVMLPSLQKMPEDVERMGKIVVASLKTMMGATLGNVGKTKGGKILDVMKRRVTTAPYPCLVILDEVGYYTVDGMAMMAAQVRSLGFSMIYASQDLKAMTRLNEKEAQSIIANTNTKIVMRTEDSDTMELAVKAGGQGEKVNSTSYQAGEDIFGNSEWTPNRDFAISFENRINELDLKSQLPGQFTILHMDFIVRGRSFYVDTLSTFDDEDSIEVAPNQFVVVKRPNIDAVESDKKIPKIMKRLTEFNEIEAEKNDITDEIKNAPTDEIRLFKERISEEKRNNKKGTLEIFGTALAYLYIKMGDTVNNFSSTVRKYRRPSENIDDHDIFEEHGIHDMPVIPPKVRTNHGIEINENGLQSIDDNIMAGTDSILDAIQDLPTTDDMDITENSLDSMTDNNKKDIIMDITDTSNITNEIAKETKSKIEEVVEVNKSTGYNDIGDVDDDISKLLNDDAFSDYPEEEKDKTDETTSDNKESSEGNNTKTEDSSSSNSSKPGGKSGSENKSTETVEDVLNFDDFLNAITDDV